MTENRILVAEVYGGCRNLRVLDEGMYCASDVDMGWELINPSECDKCKRKKQFVGLKREEVIDKIANAFDSSGLLIDGDSKIYAEIAIKAMLEK